MKNYAPILAVLLCAAMTGPLWLGRLQDQRSDSLTPPDSVLPSSPTAAELKAAQRPAPALTPEPTQPDENTRLACGFGIISRLRNRGDRCVAVPQPYSCPQPAYVYPQPCAPVQPCVPVQPQYVVPTQPIPPPSITTQPSIPTQPIVPQQPAAPPVANVPRGGPCNCQSCCQEFRLTRYRIVPKEVEVVENYIDCEVETSRFCDASCESGECVETIGIQNRKRHVVKEKPRRFTVTELVREEVVETRCIECGCIQDTRLTPSSSYGTQKPVLEQTSAPVPVLKQPQLEMLRQSQRLEWLDPKDKK